MRPSASQRLSGLNARPRGTGSWVRSTRAGSCDNRGGSLGVIFQRATVPGVLVPVTRSHREHRTRGGHGDDPGALRRSRLELAAGRRVPDRPFARAGVVATVLLGRRDQPSAIGR